MEIKDIRCNNPNFEATSSVLKPGKEFELVVTLKPTQETGGLRGDIQFATGLKEIPTVKVEVTAYVTAEVDVMPYELVVQSGAEAPATRDARHEGLRTRNEALVGRIRAGDADAGAFAEAVLAHLRATVDEKMDVSKPPRVGRELRETQIDLLRLAGQPDVQVARDLVQPVAARLGELQRGPD